MSTSTDPYPTDRPWRKGIKRITPECLATLLGHPGCVVGEVSVKNDVVIIKLYGGDLPEVLEGAIIPEV